MNANSLIFWLFLVTLAIGLGWGVWQYLRVRRSQERDLAAGRPVAPTSPVNRDS